MTKISRCRSACRGRTDSEPLALFGRGLADRLSCCVWAAKSAAKSINVFVLNDAVVDYFGAFFNVCPLFVYMAVLLADRNRRFWGYAKFADGR
jgi:hypothetical protein